MCILRVCVCVVVCDVCEAVTCAHPVVEGVLWAGEAAVVAAVVLRGHRPTGGEGPGQGASGGAGWAVLAERRRPAASRDLLQGQCGIAHSSDVHLLPGITDI